MAKKALWTIIIAAIATEIVSVYMYMTADSAGLFTDYGFLTYTNTMIVVWAILCTLCFVLTLGSFGLKSQSGRVWLFLAIGIACWAIGDILYFYFQVGAMRPDELLFPTEADWFWSLGYVFVFVGIILQMRLAKVKLSDKELAIVVIIIGVSVIISWIYVILPVLWDDLLVYEYSLDYWFFSLDYPLFDLILIPLAIILALKYRGGEFSKAWIIIVVGFIVTAIYDLLYTYFELLGAGYLLYTDIIYLAYYMLLGIGALYLRSSVQSLNK